MDTYICSVLQKVNDAGLLLDSEMAEESLMERLNGETAPELKTAAEEYLLRKITAAPAKEGAVMLAQLSGERFERVLQPHPGDGKRFCLPGCILPGTGCRRNFPGNLCMPS